MFSFISCVINLWQHFLEVGTGIAVQHMQLNLISNFWSCAFIFSYVNYKLVFTSSDDREEVEPL